MVLFAVLGTGFCEWFAEGKGQDICRSYTLKMALLRLMLI
jgi:hypothetical protein